MEDNRQEALNKAKKVQQMMLLQAEMEKQMQPTIPEVQAGSISMQPAILPKPNLIVTGKQHHLLYFLCFV